MRRIAVLGGTFDPVHLGHISILEQAAAAIGADEGWLLPAGDPAHRGPAQASADDRLAMVRAALDGHPRLRAVDLELRRPGPTYTIDTVDALARRLPGSEIWLIVGTDAAAQVRGWHRAAELLASARFVVVNRGTAGVTSDAVAAWGFDPSRTRSLSVDSPPISSTEVRRRLAAGAPVGDLVPSAVAGIIAERDLYKLS